MDKIYKMSKILAYVLAVISLLGIVGVIYSILYSRAFGDFTDWDKYYETFKSNTALVTFSQLSRILYYVKNVCLYAGMFLFFFLLQKSMAKGSRLALTITIGQVAAILCFCSTMLRVYIIMTLNPAWLNIFLIIGHLTLLIAFGSMLRFFSRKSMQQYACIAVIISTIIFGIFLFTPITPWVLINAIFLDMLYPLAFAFFYYEFSKLKK